jgi:hypothetical protein
MTPDLLMRIRNAATVAMALLAFAGGPQVRAQDSVEETERQTLMQLISAFQNCGPPQTYFLLGNFVYQTVYQQTGGTGCYPTLQLLGSLLAVRKISCIQFPAGPVTTFEATHQNGRVVWQIGISKVTDHVEWLSFQMGGVGVADEDDSSAPCTDYTAALSAASEAIPNTTTSPSVNPNPNPSPSPGPSPNPNQTPGQPVDPQQGCVVYPEMCRAHGN